MLFVYFLYFLLYRYLNFFRQIAERPLMQPHLCVRPRQLRSMIL